MTIKQLIVEDQPSKHQLTQNSSNSLHINHHLKSEKPLISVVIPLYNEEKSVRNVIERIPNHHQYEIILVDDGSTDNSLEKVKDIKNRHVKIINHKNNRGYGASIITGIRSATGDIIVTLDSDGQHCPEEIPKLIHPIMDNQADIVIGSRYLGKCNYRVPSYTKIGENMISFFLWLFFRQKVKNNQSGFKAFNKNSFKIFNRMIYNRFGLCTELIYKAAFYKYKIIEVPVSINIRKYGTSYVNIVKLFIAISTCILIYGLRKVINIFY